MGDIADMCYDIGLDSYINGDDYRDYGITHWRMGNGKLIAISDMTTRHLNNTIRFLKRQIDGSAHDDFCWDNINAMEKELKRRNSHGEDY